jgi:hypothetical protein
MDSRKARWGMTLVVGVICLILMTGAAQAQTIDVETISHYDVEVTLGDTVHQKTMVTLKNVIDKPVVPGIGEFRLQTFSPSQIFFFSIPGTSAPKPVEVENLRAITSDGKLLMSHVTEGDDYTTIRYEIWYPIQPGEEMSYILEFDSSDLAQKGVLFTNIAIPVASDLPIEDYSVTFSSDQNLVYKDGTTGTLPRGEIVFANAEFSPLPLPETGFSWSVVLWGIVLTAGIACAIWYVRREPENKEE